MAIFKALGKSMSVEEKVTVLVRRHEHNYFVGMSAHKQGVLLEHEPTHLISSTKDKQILDLLLIEWLKCI